MFIGKCMFYVSIPIKIFKLKINSTILFFGLQYILLILSKTINIFCNSKLKETEELMKKFI
jgi:hypothetical protein